MPGTQLAPGLLEREAELAHLAGLTARLDDGRGGLAVVRAQAGLGKSALLSAYAASLDRRCLVLRATARDDERDLPFGVVRQLLEPPLADPVVRRRVLVGAAAPLTTWFGDTAHPPPPALTLLRAAFWAVVALAAEHPVVVAVDDVHDSDDASLQTLVHLVHGIDELPVLVVLASRREEWGQRSQLVSIGSGRPPPLDLRPVSAAAVSDLTAEALGVVPHPEWVASCLGLTRGNPFYLHEVLQEVGRRGISPTADNAAWIATLEVPGLARATVHRHGRPVGTDLVLKAAAVLGDGAELLACARLAGLDLADAAKAADALDVDGVLDGGPGVTFSHAILRAAVLGELGGHERALLHRRAAEVLRDLGGTDLVLARHLVQSEPGHEEWAARTLARAGRQLLDQGSAAAASGLLRGALAEAPERADLDLLADAGEACLRCADRGGTELLTRAQAACDDVERRGELGLRLALCWARVGETGTSISTLDHTAAALGPDSETHLLARALRFLYTRYNPARHDEAAGLRPALEALGAGALSPARAAVRVVLASDACHRRPRAEAVAAFTPDVVEALHRLSPTDTTAHHLALETMLTLELDDEADALVEWFARDATRRGEAVDLVAAAHFRALAAYHRGLPVEAAQEAGDTLRAGAWTGWPVGACVSWAILALAHHQTGHDAEATDALVRAEDLLGPISGKPAAMVHLARGRLRQAAGDHETARACFAAAGEALAPTGSTAPGLLAWSTDLVESMVALGDTAAACRLAEDQVELASRVAGPRAQASALRALGGCGTDPAPYERALAVLDAGTHTRLERARVLHDLGALSRRTGHPAAARTHLGEALDLAQRVGATRLADQVRDELQVAGGRPRRGYLSGTEALTAGERRVARLAAGGATNAVIAQQLFVSTKTVEKHLGSAFRKLEITTRAGLPADL